MKEKLKHLKSNLLWEIPTAILTYLLVSSFLPNTPSIFISIIFYFYEVRNVSKFDFLEERIEKLESKLKSDEKTLNQ